MLGCQQAGDPPAEGLAPDGDLRPGARLLEEDGHGALRASTRQLHRLRLDPALLETIDVGPHRSRIPGRSVAEKDHRSSSSFMRSRASTIRPRTRPSIPLATILPTPP